MRKCTIHIVKTKAMISFTVTAKLVCAFVFTYSDCCFSDAAHSNFESAEFQICTFFCNILSVMLSLSNLFLDPKLVHGY